MDKKVHVDTRTIITFWLVPLAIVLFWLFVTQAAQALLIIGSALFLALAIAPLVNKIAKRVPGHKRNLATALSYVVVVGVLVAILSVIVPIVVEQTAKLIDSLPDAMRSDSDLWNNLNSFGTSIGIPDLHGQVMSAVNTFADNFDFGGAILGTIGTIGNILATVFLALVLGFLMLIDGPRIIEAVKSKFAGSKRAPKAIRTIERMGELISKFVYGELFVALINACVTALTVFILSLIFGFSAGLALPFGLITGTLCLVPMFGSFVGFTIVSLILILSSPWAALIFFVVAVIYLQLEGNVIYPRIQSKGLHLPTLVVLGAITIGIYTFGLLGAIIAVPIAGCIKILIEEYAPNK